MDNNLHPLHVVMQPCYDLSPIPWPVEGHRARELLEQFSDFYFSHLEWESYSWPGGYECFFEVKDGGVLCHQCANKELERTIDPDDAQFYIVGSACNYEDQDMYCDHCNRRIVPAYGDEE